MAATACAERTVFFTGDVMTGRGIDQILPHRGDPALREPVVSDATTYIAIAEQVNGPIPAPVDYAWPWGEARSVIDLLDPDLRLINLETTITTAGEFAPHKAVHYRMHPGNVACLSAIRPDICALANNHILDFGYQGLAETLQVLTAAGILSAGAGLDDTQAGRPVVWTCPDGGRTVVLSCGMSSSGIPRGWAAGRATPGVAFVTDHAKHSSAAVADRVLAQKRSGDIAVVSVHWGSNWGYDVVPEQVRFAHRLIDAGVDVVHGHSSHHPRPIEVYRGKLILYGCGDTIDDYEGIRTYQAYRHDLRLLYFASLDRSDGAVTALRMVPMRMRRMRLERVSTPDAEWLRRTLETISRPFRTRVTATGDGVLIV